MKKKAIALLLSVIVILVAAVPFTLANETNGEQTSSSFQLDAGTCTVCGLSGEHSADCAARCTCGDAKPEFNHLFDCELFSCGICGALLNQTGGMHYAGCAATLPGTGITPPCTDCGLSDGHSADCSTLCSCGESKPETGHIMNCTFYACGECGALLNQNGGVHNEGCILIPAPAAEGCTECGETEGHLITCSSFACGECGALLNRTGGRHTAACSQYDIWAYAGEYQDICLIGFLNKSSGSVRFFGDAGVQEGADFYTYVNAADCPDYLILNTLYPDTSGGAPLFYGADSFDAGFYDSVLSYAWNIEASAFSAVVPAAGLYATVGGDSIDLLKTPVVATDGFATVSGSELSSEYVVADFYYDMSGTDWYIKLTPDENWPEGVDPACCWVRTANITGLSLSSSEPPEPTGPVNGEDCGDGCTVEGCTCACHNALLQRFCTATTLEELDVMIQAATEEEWNTLTEDVMLFLDAFAEALPSIYDPVVSDPSVESEVRRPAVNFTNAAGFGAPVTGQ